MRPGGYDDLMAEGDQQPRQPYFSIGTPLPATDLARSKVAIFALSL